MADTTYEEAKRCPKCKEPGLEVGDTAAPRGRGVTIGARLKHIQCRNQRCKWFDGAPYLVQTNPDGTVPPPNMHREKQFRALPDDGGRTAENLQRQFEAEMLANAEIHRR